MKTVEGKDQSCEIMLFTLSTCGWCRKTKNLFDELDVRYSFVDVDLLDFDEKAKVKEELRQHNPRASYPTIVIDGDPIIGFDRDKIMKKINKQD